MRDVIVPLSSLHTNERALCVRELMCAAQEVQIEQTAGEKIRNE